MHALLEQQTKNLPASFLNDPSIVSFLESVDKAYADSDRRRTELEQFAYIASHDLQEPLRMVASYLHLLQQRYKDKLDQDAQDFIGFAIDGAMRMRTLIDDLLTFSRVSSKTQTLEPVDSRAIFDLAVTNLKISIEEKHAVVTRGNLPMVMASPVAFVQLLQNLISNGLKFQKSDTPSVHVDCQMQNGEWVFSVKDNGIGIDPAHQERIFAIFQRLHTKQEYPGTGIGLAVCKKIVEQHDGRIWVESEPGKGATFYFSLPVKRGT